MKSKKLPKDTKVAVYMRVGREEQLTPQEKLLSETTLTEAQKRAKEKYRKKTTQVLIEFYPQDAELLKKVQEQPNKQAYIKELIKKDLQ